MCIYTLYIDICIYICIWLKAYSTAVGIQPLHCGKESVAIWAEDSHCFLASTSGSLGTVVVEELFGLHSRHLRRYEFGHWSQHYAVLRSIPTKRCVAVGVATKRILI